MRLSRVRQICLSLAVFAASSAALVPTGLLAWQPYVRFDRLTMDDGLPDEYVMSMAQDRYGYLWFATGAGLAKYDGHEFRVYRADPDDPGSLSSATVISVYVDRAGTVWAGTDVGLDRFDRETGAFTHFRHDPEDANSLGGNVIREIYEDREGILWVGSWFGGLTGFDRANGTFERFRHDPEDATSLPAGAVFEITEDRAGNLWVGTVNGERTADAARLDRESGRFVRIFTCDREASGCASPETEADHPENHFVSKIHHDDEGGLWFVGGELTRYDAATNTYRSYMHRFDTGFAAIGGLLEDGETGFWLVDTYSGLVHFDPAAGVLAHYRNDPADPNSLATDMVNQLFRDRDGRIWVSAYEVGISSFDPAALQLGAYRFTSTDPDNLLGAADVRWVAEAPSGHLWVVYNDEARRIAPDRASVQVYTAVDDWTDGRCLGAFDYVLVHSDGTVWVASDHGMCRYDPVTDRLARFPVPAPEVRSPDDDPNDYGVVSMTEDPEGYLWIQTILGMNRFDPHTGEVVNFLPDSVADQSGLGDKLSARLFDDNGDVWFASTTGMVRLNRNTGALKKYNHDPEDPNSISPGFVTDLVRFDGFWVSSATGLDRFDPQAETFEHIVDTDGMPLGIVSRIVTGADGNLWLSGSRGLWRMNPQTRALSNFGPSDGVVNEKLSGGMVTASGQLLFGGGAGINRFDPAGVRARRWEGDIRVTEFLLANRPVPVSSADRPTPLASDIDAAKTFELSWRDYLFGFEFAALNFGRTEAMRYAYLLDGFDTNWVETGPAHRIATYTNVPPGTYAFRVRARAPQGEWRESGQSIEVVIAPPPWRTAWAYLLYALAAVATVLLLIRMRTASLRKRASELQHAVDERTREVRDSEARIRSLAGDLEHQLERNENLIANITHEFRTPLTLILGPANRMLERVEKPENAALLQMIRRNSRRLLRLVDQLLGLSRLKSDETVPREPQDVHETISAIVESFGPIATERGLDIRFEGVPGLWVRCMPDTLDNLVLNLLSNAVKNTPSGGRVSVTARALDADWIELAVADTGIGIAPEARERVFERFQREGGHGERLPGAGIGLALVRELVEAHGGRIALDSEPGEGTTVSLTLPAGEPPAEPGSVRGPAALKAAVAQEIGSIATPAESFEPTRDEDGQERPLILVVEDNADMRAYVGDLIRESCDCIEAATGEEGLRLAFEHIPDLVVCDIVLPGLDGFQVSHELKSDQRTSHVPIILLTARHDRDSRLEGWKEKVDGYLTKPFDDTELMLRISNLLEIREILKSHFACHFFNDVGSSHALAHRDREFMERLEAAMSGGHEQESFGVEQMAAAAFMSPRQLQRKLKALTGQTPSALLRAFRLRRARELLRTGMAVGQVADTVGFSSPAYFSTCFKAQFGMPPGAYQNSNGETSTTVS